MLFQLAIFYVAIPSAAVSGSSNLMFQKVPLKFLGRFW